MAATAENHPNTFTKPMVEAWSGLLRRAVDSKREFSLRGEQISEFYTGSAGFMWQGNYLEKFMGGAGGLQPPKFRADLKKAFEFVALMGPMLFWQMARRKVKPHRSLSLDPNVLAAGDPLLLQFLNQMADEQATDDARNSMRAAVLEHILNYCQREQPHGGLGSATKSAVDESLVLGAGFLHTRPYRYPDSDKTLVGSFHVSCEDIFVDPDCRDPRWEGAMWVAIRHSQSFWQVEERFNLPRGSLRSYGTGSSYGSSWGAGRTDIPPIRIENASRDRMEWYEIFSRAGCGNKLCGTQRVIDPEFDDWAGDFSYLAISKNCPYPLNLPSNDLLGEHATEEWIKEQLSWPTEYWRDNKWPISKLDYYQKSGTSAWPEPPLASAIGELTILNILISAYVQTAYESRQTIIGVVQGAFEDLEGLMQSNKSPLVIELQPQVNKSVSDVLSFIQRPEINGDIPKTIQFLLELVEKRTGLSDMLYGQNTGANPRSATEFQGKMSTVNIRPEYMQKRVAEWQSEVAEKEVFALYQHVKASDIGEQLGPLGRPAYEMLVTNENPEVILRGAKCYVEASEMSRPNKDHDAHSLRELMQYLMPTLAGHASQFNDFGPLNGFLSEYCDASEIDCSEFLLQLPPPDEQEQQMHQATAQATLQKLQAEGMKLQAEARNLMDGGASSEAQLQIKQQESAAKIQAMIQTAGIKSQATKHAMGLKTQDAAAKVQSAMMIGKLKAAEAAAKIGTIQQTGQLKAMDAEHSMEAKVSLAEIEAMLQKQKFAQNQETHSQTLAQREKQARLNLTMDIFKGRQQMQQSDDAHQQTMSHQDASAVSDIKHGQMISYSKMLMNTAMSEQRKSQSTP